MARDQVTITIGAQDNASHIFQGISAELKKLQEVAKSTHGTASAMDTMMGKFSVATPKVTGFAAALAEVKLQAAQLSSRLGPVGEVMRALGPAATAATAGITAMVIAGAGIIRLTNQVARLGDELEEMAYATGVSVENLSTLKFGADISGSSLQSLRIALKTMSVNAFDAFQAMKKGGETLNADAQIWEQLGITITDTNGQLKPAYTLFLQAADALSQLTSDTERAAIAQKLFGRSGSDLLPFLAKGSQGIQDMQEQARKLNGEFSTEMAARSAKYQDAIAGLAVAFGGLGRAIAEETIGPLTVVVGLLTRITTIGGFVAKGILSSPEKELREFARKWTKAPGVPQAPMFGSDKTPALPRLSDQQIEEIARGMVADDQAAGNRARDLQALIGKSGKIDILRDTTIPSLTFAEQRQAQQKKASEDSLKLRIRMETQLVEVVSLKKTAPTMQTNWQRMAASIKDMFTGTSGVFPSLTTGLREYQESLGTLSQRVRSAVLAGMQAYHAGLQEAVGGFLWGDDERKGVDDAKKRLEEMQSLAEGLDLGIITGGGARAEATRGQFEALFGLAQGEQIPPEYKEKIGEIQAAFMGVMANPTPESKSALIQMFDDLTNRMDREGGVLNRFKDLGSNIVDAMKDGMKTTITGAFTAVLEDSLAALGTSMLSGMLHGKASAVGANAVAATNEGAEANKGPLVSTMTSIGTTVGDTVRTATGALASLGSAIPVPSWSDFASAMSSIGSAATAAGSSVVSALGAIGGKVPRPDFTEVWNTIADYGGAIWEAATSMVGSLQTIGSKIPRPDFSEAWNSIADWGGTISDAASAIVGGLATIGSKIPKPDFSEALSAINDFGAGLVETGKGWASRIKNGVNAIDDSIFDFDFFFAISDGLSAVGDLMGSIGTGFINALKGGVDSGEGGVFDKLKTAVEQMASLSSKTITYTANVVKTGAQSSWDQVERFGGLAGKALDFTASLAKAPGADGVWSLLEGTGQKSIQAAISISQTSVEEITSLFGSLGRIGSAVQSGLGNALVSAWAAGEIAGKVGALFGPEGAIGLQIGASLGAVVGSVFGPAGTTIGAGIGAAIGGMIAAITGSVPSAPDQPSRGQLSRVIAGMGGIKSVMENVNLQGGDLSAFLTRGGWGGLGGGLTGGRGSEAQNFLGAELRAMLESAGYGSGEIAEVFDRFGNFTPPPSTAAPPALDPTMAAVNATTISAMVGARQVSLGLIGRMGKTAFDAATLWAQANGRPSWSGGTYNAYLEEIARLGRSSMNDYGWNQMFGVNLVAKQGIARVPGGENQAYPAILHGGERVLTAEENRSYGGITIAPVFNISARSASDGAAIVDAIRRDALPMLEREVDRIIRRGSRFGRLEMDSRTIRSGL